ncbi:hypothetical protein GCM10027018_07860 [Paenibacillus thermoaerophilus]
MEMLRDAAERPAKSHRAGDLLPLSKRQCTGGPMARRWPNATSAHQYLAYRRVAGGQPLRDPM